MPVTVIQHSDSGAMMVSFLTDPEFIYFSQWAYSLQLRRWEGCKSWMGIISLVAKLLSVISNRSQGPLEIPKGMGRMPQWKIFCPLPN